MEQEKPTKPETDRTFPEDDDTLYREMTVHMPRCYFPTSLGENSILKFAGEEFRRVKYPARQTTLRTINHSAMWKDGRDGSKTISFSLPEKETVFEIKRKRGSRTG